RKAAPEWKKGFYYIAYQSRVPIMMAYIDYGKKEIGIKGLFYPTGDVEADISKIRTYYQDVTARHPKQFIQI
ncbi:MAG: acyltransferase, partial [Tannerellaceae bacterium]|nr:acyltransferase [Tannerellaceae bacterium]